MKTKLMMLLAAGGAAWLFAADTPKKQPSEFDKLKAKVTLIEGRLAQLETRLLSLTPTPRISFETPAQLPASDAPPNVGELEVNGLTIYKVPLSAPK